MNIRHPVLLVLLIVLNLPACSDNNAAEQQKQKDHVWKEQTDAMEKARAVEGILQESADQQQKQIHDEAQ